MRTLPLNSLRCCDVTYPASILTWQGGSNTWNQVASRDAYDSTVDLGLLSELRWLVEFYGD